MNKILLVLSIALLSGCSTEMVPPSKAKLAPANQLYKFQETNPNDGVLTVVRDSGFISAGCAASLYINGEKAAILNQKEKAIFHLPPGEWAVGATFDGKGMCNSGIERQERYINIKTDDSKTVRIYIDNDANVDIKPTTVQ